MWVACGPVRLEANTMNKQGKNEQTRKERSMKTNKNIYKHSNLGGKSSVKFLTDVIPCKNIKTIN
jgi:hypothetical protein